MNTKITFLKTMLFVFAIAGSITIQAQPPLVHLKFENNLDNDGSSALTFAVEGANSAGVSVPYSMGTITSLLTGVGDVPGNIEGTYAINFSVIGDDTDPNYNLIQNGGGFDAQIISNANLGITGNNARSFSAWFRYDDRLNTTNGTHMIVHIGSPANGGGYLRNTLQHAGANNRIQFGIGGAAVQWYYGSDGDNIESTVEDGNWHHVAVTYAGGTATIKDVKIYFDGAEVTTDGAGTSGVGDDAMATSDDKVLIGSRNNGQKWFDGGGIDDVRIFNVELSAAQVLALYNENALNTINFAAGELKAYPTVVEDFLNIQTASKGELNISVFDITGKNISESTGNSVDMRGLTSGLYIVKVREANKVANLKILKK
ncbi:T9SS type A sorting domain-containing protein [Seonamhaeicola sp. MEBiC1930]|uniref:LamG-like jellyroll fold domain-containing protein n=1 Tax=Seonamhaeicola sp. MEBiC01930 TaxID=2976768 RepID=UPI00324FDE8D